MIAADRPRADPASNRLAVVGGDVVRATDLPALLAPGDLVVVNDAATLPASLPGTVGAQPVEWRLASQPAAGLWWAIALGAGDWREDTDRRGAPPPLDGAATAAGVDVAIVARSPLSPRLALLRPLVDDDAFVAAVYRRGRPVQYSYLPDALQLAAFQTPWAGPPWAVEAPSAAFCLTWRVLDALQARGVGLATVTHAAGLSATGDPALDAKLPLPERYDVPEATLRAVRATRARGGRVIAAGTSAARALESAARGPRCGTTRLRLGPDTPLRLLDGLLSNVHGPGEPHFRLMTAFADAGSLARSYAGLVAAGALVHEFGDGMLVFTDSR